MLNAIGFDCDPNASRAEQIKAAREARARGELPQLTDDEIAALRAFHAANRRPPNG